MSQNKMGGFETNTFTFGVGAPFALSIKDILAAIDTTLKMYYNFGHINVIDRSNVVVQSQVTQAIVYFKYCI